jgi:hypothetical protein
MVGPTKDQEYPKLEFGMVGPVTVRYRNSLFRIPDGFRVIPPRYRDDAARYHFRNIAGYGKRIFSLQRVDAPTVINDKKWVPVTHRRSPAAKERRNARKNNRSRYRLKGCNLLHNVLDVGLVPLGRYKYHEARYKKAGRPFVLRRTWGFRLRNQRKYDLPMPVVDALLRIYSNDNVTKTLKKGKRRLVPKLAKKEESTPQKPRKDYSAEIGFYSNQIYLARAAGNTRAHSTLQQALANVWDLHDGKPFQIGRDEYLNGIPRAKQPRS